MTDFNYQWERDDGDIAGASGVASVPVPGSVTETYVPVVGDVGHTIRLRVEGGGSTYYSSWVGPVTAEPVVASASLYGPWLDPISPWRTKIPSDWASHVHPDTASMVQGVYIGTDYSSYDVHAFAYRPTEMQNKWGSAGLTYMKWLGPGGVENVVYGSAGDTFNRIYMDFPSYKASSILCPIPINWNGYDRQSANERRTIILCDDGRVWVAYGITPPGVTPFSGNGPADSFWHAVVATQIQNWDDVNFTWASGGSGLSHGGGLIIPPDIEYAREHGDFGHALAINSQSQADGSFAGHPKGVWPATKGINNATSTDGRTKTAVGIPYGARVFLDPSLTDSDLNALGVVKEWMFWMAHTMQRYGCIAKEQTVGQGSAGCIMCETMESITWNASHSVPGYSGFQWPWFADGTMSGDHNTSTYNGAFPPALVPTSGSHWKVFDWNDAYPGITVPA